MPHNGVCKLVKRAESKSPDTNLYFVATMGTTSWSDFFERGHLCVHVGQCALYWVPGQLFETQSSLRTVKTNQGLIKTLSRARLCLVSGN